MYNIHLQNENKTHTKGANGSHGINQCIELFSIRVTFETTVKLNTRHTELRFKIFQAVKRTVLKD